MSISPESTTQPPDFQPRQPMDDEALHGLGHTAVPEGLVPPPAETTEQEIPFAELNPDQLFAQFIADVGSRKIDEADVRSPNIDIAAPSLSIKSRETIVQSAYSIVHDYRRRKHDHEWEHETENADPRPLPEVPMLQRIRDFYKNPDIALVATDKVHQANLNKLHDQFESNYAYAYRAKIPEIGDVYVLQEKLYKAKYFDACLILNDLLAVYGQALRALIVASAQQRERQAEAQARNTRTFED